MLTLKLITENTEEVKTRLKLKYFKNTRILTYIISNNKKRKETSRNLETNKNQLKVLSNEIHKLSSLTKDEKKIIEKKKEIKKIKASINRQTKELNSIEKKLNNWLVLIPSVEGHYQPN